MVRYLGIFDVDKGFTTKLVSYMNSGISLPFDVVAFTNITAVERYIEDNQLDVLVVSEELIKDVDNIGFLGITLILSEEKSEASDRIYKYQPAGMIVEKILNNTKSFFSRQGLAQTSLIGVYGGSGGEDKTAIALNLSYIFGKRGKVLHISFDKFSVISKILGEEDKGTLSEVMYDYLEQQGSISQILGKSIITYGGIDIVESVQCPEDLEDVDINSYLDLVMNIMGEGLYDTIVLDFGDVLKRQWKLINMCNQVFLVRKEGSVAEYGMSKVKDYLSKRMSFEHSRKLVEAILPEGLLPTNNLESVYRGEYEPLTEYVGGLING